MNPADGKLVIGGYDKSRIVGDFTTFPLNNSPSQQPCPLSVRIKSIQYSEQDPRSTKTLFAANNSVGLESDQYILACVEPFQERFSFPQNVTDAFGNATGWGLSKAYGGFVFPVKERPSGNLTITLDNGYSTTIPNSALFTPKRGSDQYGHYVITNSSLVEAGVAYNLDDDPSSIRPLLGGTWLTQNYLLVDYTANRFQLAEALQGPGIPEIIQSICNSTAELETSPTNKPEKKGKIVGGVVGGVIGCAALGGLVLLVSRKRHHQRVRQEKNVHHATPSLDIVRDPYKDYSSPNELPLVCASCPHLHRHHIG